ncbi:MAG TPA: hypothetical protein VK645_02330 [Chitinophagaceae bacterium]|nr:hypothetical protein [Chitinophagaceae bacterium]
MEKQTTRINLTRQFLEKAKAKLEALLYFAAPDEQFRFVTFEHDDYAEHKLTMLLFSFIPDRVFVTVPAYCSLDMAVAEVEQLNPKLNFEKVELTYFDEADVARKRQTQELRIIYTPMKVDMTGKLIL